MSWQKKQLRRGMSMVEILVVIGLTSMLLIGAMSMLSSAVRVQSETLARQSMIDQASYVLDVMTKELRMARKDYLVACNVHMIDQVSGEPTSTTYGIRPVWDSANSKFIDNSEIWFYSQENGTCYDFKFDPASSTIKVGAFSTSSDPDPDIIPNQSLIGHLSLYNSRIPYTNDEQSEKMSFMSLFSDDIAVENFQIAARGIGIEKQPMITISMRLRHKIKKSLAPVDIQTSVSARNINWTPNQ